MILYYWISSPTADMFNILQLPTVCNHWIPRIYYTESDIEIPLDAFDWQMIKHSFAASLWIIVHERQLRLQHQDG